MACYRPLKAFYLPNQLCKNPKYRPDAPFNAWDFSDREYIPGWNYKITSSKVLGFRKEDGKRIFNKSDLSDGDYTEFHYIPCRHCYGCREDSAKAWTDRLMIELQDHEEAWFVTLTYSDEFLPMCFLPNEYGVLPDRPTLRKKDFQDFMKRLRKDQKDHLMYYAAGEYGDEGKRPHYHAIIFGLHLEDLQLWKQRSGFKYYTSEYLSNKWPFGFVAVAKVNRATAAYTCRYVMKKAFGEEKQYYYDLGIEPEFQLMSKNPAIARNYYDRVVDGKQGDYYVNKVHYLTGPDAEPISFAIPKYFDYLTEKENSDILVSVKEKRKKIGKARQKLLEAHSSKPYEEILADQESVKISSNINFRNSSKGGKL